MITTVGLTKSFSRRRVLCGLDLSVGPGAVTLLVGANGAGKTTALRIIAGLSRCDEGTISICGHNLRTERSDALACMSFLPQAPRFHPRLTVRHVAEFYARLRGCPRNDVHSALEAWGVLEYADMPTAKLSGGLRQRLALAVFGLADAPALILDEPGLSLDPEWRQHLQDFLSRKAQRGRTVLVATHLLGEWEGHTDRCILVEQGRATAELPPNRLRNAYPRAEATAPTHRVELALA